MPWPTTSRHERGYGSEWDHRRKRILERDKYLCQPCLKKGRVHVGNQVDHRIPKAQGGTDDDENLQAINDQCHKLKTAEENAERHGRAPKRKLTFGADGWPVA